jgi:predicted small integral membrane protein
MLYDIIYSIGLIAVVGGIAFFIGRRMPAKPGTKSKTTTFLMKSIQAIAELAVLEYRTEGATEIKEKNLLFY